MNRRIIPTLLVFYLQQTPVQAETTTPEVPNSLRQEISAMQQQLDKLTASIDPDNPTSPYGLKLSGFFDITANISDMNNHPFQLGNLEVDAVYDKAENFAVSAAGIVNDEGAIVDVAILDYHVHGHNTPARGSLFEEQGYHIQIGRFDISFSSDYAFIAAPDRINISAPLTTDRVQGGNLGGDGLRVYGLWSDFEYTAYYTNSLLEDTGYSAGTRIGYNFGDNFVVGVSALNNKDENNHTRSRLSALDLGLQVGFASFYVEAVQLDSEDDVLVNSISTGPADESGSHISMALDFSPLTVFVRYETWTPDYTAVPNEDNTGGYAVEELDRVTLAARYVLDDYLQLKAEYFRYTGETAEPDFERHNTRVQVVAKF
jgi:hypothetical protein